jgi:hypothetical protein
LVLSAGNPTHSALGHFTLPILRARLSLRIRFE